MYPKQADQHVPDEQPTVIALAARTDAAMQSSSSPDCDRLGRRWQLAAHSCHFCPEASSDQKQGVAVGVHGDLETLKDN